MTFDLHSLTLSGLAECFLTDTSCIQHDVVFMSADFLMEGGVIITNEWRMTYPSR